MKLAEFVARNGRQFEEVTRQRNPGETPFKYVLNPVCFQSNLLCKVGKSKFFVCSARFLLDASSPVYKWYDQKVLDIRNQLAGTSQLLLLMLACTHMV